MSDAVTREEQYYRAMLGEGTAPTPITRKEKWLNRIAEALANSGGTGGGGTSGGGSGEPALIYDLKLTEDVKTVDISLDTAIRSFMISMRIPSKSDITTNNTEVAVTYVNGVYTFFKLSVVSQSWANNSCAIIKPTGVSNCSFVDGYYGSNNISNIVAGLDKDIKSMKIANKGTGENDVIPSETIIRIYNLA